MSNIVVDDYTALLSGDSWNGVDVSGQPVIVTFSFPTVAPGYDSSVSGFTSTTVGSFASFSPDEQTQALAALNEWAAASGLVFVQVAPGQGDINFQNINLSTTSGYSGDAAGIGFYPFGDWTYASLPSFSSDLTASGDVFMNSADQAGDGTVNYGTLLHEIGHAIGLKHPLGTDDDILGVDHDDVLSSNDPTRTIMATVGDPSGDDHLKPFDKAAAADLYGPAGTGGVYTASASGSNSVSNWSWDATTETLTQTAATVGETIHGTSVDDIITGSSGNDSLFGLAGNNQLYGGAGDDSLYDGPGQNLLVGGSGDDSYYVTNPNTVIVENVGGGDDTVYSTVSYTLSANVETLQLYGSGLTGTGNAQDDSIYGDGTYGSTLIAGAGDDYMVGGAGDDTLQAGAGVDTMFGGGGVNTFVFKAASDAAPGANLNEIGDFVSGRDKIDLSAIKTTGASPGQDLTYIGNAAFTNVAGQVNEVQYGNETVLEGDLDGDGVADFQIAVYSGLGGPLSLQADDLVLSSTACYRRGTRILTDRGEIPVEALLVGDLALTPSGARRPIVWIGHRRLDPTRHPEPDAVWPVRVAAGAFGEALPRRDLWLSPRHAVAVEGALIPIVALINGASVRQVKTDAVEYWHVELDAHDVIVAEGLPAESYLDNGNRTAFANGGAFVDAHPDFKPKHWRDTCLALVEEGPQVERTRARLFERLGALGYALCDDADPHGLADGRRIEPIVLSETRIGFLLPPGCRDGALASRTFAPAHVDPRSADARELGLCVRRLWVDGDDVALDADELPGWHEAEDEAGAFTHRWTRGRVALPPGARFVIVDFAGCGRYWREPEARLVAGSAKSG